MIEFEQKESISMKLKAIRGKASLTQSQAALAIGRPQQTLAGWESGRSQPDVETLNKLLALYNVSPNEFYGFSGDKKTAITVTEQQHIKKYRILDEHGKKMVDFVLDEEYTRCVSPNHDPEPAPTNIFHLRRSEQPASAGTGAYLGPESFHIVAVQENELTQRTSFTVPVTGDSMEPYYYDGDLLLVADEEVELGDIGLFTLEGCGYVKKLGHGELISLNLAYKPIPMDDSIRCNGKIIGILDPNWLVED